MTRKIEKAGSIENTFKAVAEGFLSTNASKWSKSHHRHIKECFERDVYPWLGSRWIIGARLVRLPESPFPKY
ncbi:MAG: phage integrase central domain-containing protein [Gammaproteobacteria bacterium]